jgi:hypothetical protein
MRRGHRTAEGRRQPSSQTKCWSNGVKEHVTFGPPLTHAYSVGIVTWPDGHTLCYSWTDWPPLRGSRALFSETYRDDPGTEVGTIFYESEATVYVCPDGEYRRLGQLCLTNPPTPPTCTAGACKL